VISGLFILCTGPLTGEGNYNMASNVPRILIVDDEEEIRRVLTHIVESEGFKTLHAPDGNKALQLFCFESPDMILLDVRMPGLDGMEVMKRVKDIDPDIPVVLITAFADIQQAVEAMKSGAHDYLAKPFDNQEVIRVVRRALTEGELRKNLKHLISKKDDRHVNLVEYMGHSDIIIGLVADVHRVARSDFSVIISGETGCGKELVARAIHGASPRCNAPFIPFDCGAIPENLLESELFGHEKGSFTGAESREIGKFEIAQGGTLFMDEVANMSRASQSKFLRVLQDKALFRVGGTKPIAVDIRFITATNQDLQELTAGGMFRRDLFYRLNEFSIHVPALRDRREDIPYLAKRFLDLANLELGKMVTGYSDEAVEVMMAYNWPGNVRQLRATIRRAALMARDVITKKDLNLKRAFLPGLAFTPKVQGLSWRNASLSEIVQQSTFAVERAVIKEVLKYTGGNKAKAARLLRIDYKTMHTKVKKLGMSLQGRNHEESETGQ